MDLSWRPLRVMISIIAADSSLWLRMDALIVMRKGRQDRSLYISSFLSRMRSMWGAHSTYFPNVFITVSPPFASILVSCRLVSIDLIIINFSFSADRRRAMRSNNAEQHVLSRASRTLLLSHARAHAARKCLDNTATLARLMRSFYGPQPNALPMASA